MEPSTHTPDQEQIIARLDALVNDLKRRGAIRSAHIEAAFRAIPRHLFLPNVPIDDVYQDQSITTKRLNEQTVSSSSQPTMMAIMLHQLDLKPGQRVLEIGAGTGYNAALIGNIVGETGAVYSIDIDDDIVTNARTHLNSAGLNNVHVICDDGAQGYATAAPYDRVILTVAAWDITPAWYTQLKRGGRLVLPLSLRGPQKSIAFIRENDHLKSVSVQDCGFVRMRGAFSGPEGSYQIGPEPGLFLELYNDAPLEIQDIYKYLQSPSTDITLPFNVNLYEIFGSMVPWLALQEQTPCTLTAEGDMLERSPVPCLINWPGQQKRSSTYGAVGNNGLCFLVRPSDVDISPGQMQWDQPFNITLRSFGSDDRLTARVIEHLELWNTSGRPSANKMEIKVYPLDHVTINASNQFIMDKLWHQFIVTWANNQ